MDKIIIKRWMKIVLVWNLIAWMFCIGLSFRYRQWMKNLLKSIACMFFIGFNFRYRQWMKKLWKLIAWMFCVGFNLRNRHWMAIFWSLIACIFCIGLNFRFCHADKGKTGILLSSILNCHFCRNSF